VILNKVRSKTGQSFGLALRVAKLKLNIPSIRPPSLMKRRPERGNASLRLRVTLDVRQEEAQPSPTIGLLRLDGARRGEEAAGHGTEERPTLHYSIT